MATATKRASPGPGRPSVYDPDLVRDMSVQVMTHYLNQNPDVLRAYIRKDPEFPNKLRARAASIDSQVRSWLEALDAVPADHDDYRREVMFHQWCLRLEPAERVSDMLPNREKFLRDVFKDAGTWEQNAAQWVDAIERVRKDKSIALNIPPTLDPAETEDEDDFL